MENITQQIYNFFDECVSVQSWYSDIKDHLKVVILYGSVAKGTNRPDSDIDLLFILPLDIEEKFTQGEYFLNHHGQEFNIVMRSVEKLRDIAEGEYDAFQAEIFRNSKIIWEKDNEVQGLIEKISKAQYFSLSSSQY